MSAVLALMLLISASPAQDAGFSAIVNGTSIEGEDFPSAVAIGFEFNGYRQASCTASLITPRLLLTAGHCTDEFVRMGLPESQIISIGAAFFGARVEGAVQAVGFADFINHPDYGGTQQPSNDIGVVVLEEDAPVASTWFQDVPLEDGVLVGMDVFSVGYGVTGSNAQNSSGIKRFAELTVDEVDDQFLISYTETNLNRAGVCSGDSGGPQYAVTDDGSLIQVGVHSYVFGFSGDPCEYASGSTRVDQYSEWVYQQVEAVHGTRDRCAIQDLYDNRICESFCEAPDTDCTLDLDQNGTVSDLEFEDADRNGDGVIDEKELGKVGKGCSQTGGAGLWLTGLLALGLRRRR